MPIKAKVFGAAPLRVGHSSSLNREKEICSTLEIPPSSIPSDGEEILHWIPHPSIRRQRVGLGFSYSHSLPMLFPYCTSYLFLLCLSSWANKMTRALIPSIKGIEWKGGGVGSIDLAEASVAVAISSEISTFVSVILTYSAWSPRNTPSDSRTNSVQRLDSRKSNWKLDSLKRDSQFIKKERASSSHISLSK